MKRIILLVTVALLMTVFAGVANAQPADIAPVGSGHTHHIHTGNGGCVDIDSVQFEAVDKGLHQGATQSGRTQGPSHQTCANTVHQH